MFLLLTLSVSGRYIWTLGSGKICISFRSWKLKLVKTESSRNTYRGVDFNTTRFVPGGFSCTNSPSSCTWRKVLDGYNRNILVNTKSIFEFIVLEHKLLTEKHKAKTRAIGAAVKGAFRAFDPKPGGSKITNGTNSQNFNPGIRNCDFWFPGNNLWKRPHEYILVFLLVTHNVLHFFEKKCVVHFQIWNV